MVSHEIDYKIFGDDIQFVEIELDPRETVISEEPDYWRVCTWRPVRKIN